MVWQIDRIKAELKDEQYRQNLNSTFDSLTSLLCLRESFRPSILQLFRQSVTEGIMVLARLKEGRSMGEEFIGITSNTFDGKCSHLIGELVASLLRILKYTFSSLNIGFNDDMGSAITGIIPFFERLVFVRFLLMGGTSNLIDFIVRRQFWYTNSKIERTSGNYKVLAFILSISVLLDIYRVAKTVVMKFITTSGGSKELLETKNIDLSSYYDSHCYCSICASNAYSPTCLPCGHIYCWDCVVRWTHHQLDKILKDVAADENQLMNLKRIICPQCRRPYLIQQCLVLQNFQKLES